MTVILCFIFCFFRSYFPLYAVFPIKKSYGKSLVFLNREILAAIGAKP